MEIKVLGSGCANCHKIPGLIVNGNIRHSSKPLSSLEKVKELIKTVA